MMTSKYRHNGLRDLGLGDAVMVSKERWRKHVMGCEIYETIAELKDDMREEQKKRALDGWERMNVKRSLEDSLRCVLLYSFLDKEY